MRMTIAWLGVVLGAAALVSPVRADPWWPGCRPQAPDACGPGTYVSDPCGIGFYGPCYWLRPPWPPFSPALPGPGGGGPGGMGPGGPMGPIGTAAFPSHIFSRSPRDYFMMD